MSRAVQAVGEPRRPPWSVRSHLLGIVAVAAAVLLVVGSISTALSFRDARRNALGSADSEARLVASEVSSAIAEARESLAATVASGGLAGVFGNPEGDCTLTSGGTGPFTSGDLHLLLPSGVVVVEDEPGVRRLIERILSAHGYQVLVARNGEQALTLVELTSAIDLLVTDAVMPGLSGADLAHEISERQGPTKTLFVSGYAEMFADRRLAKTEGYLSKPFTAEQLLDAVIQVLRPGEKHPDS